MVHAILLDSGGAGGADVHHDLPEDVGTEDERRA